MAGALICWSAASSALFVPLMPQNGSGQSFKAIQPWLQLLEPPFRCSSIAQGFGRGWATRSALIAWAGHPNSGLRLWLSTPYPVNGSLAAPVPSRRCLVASVPLEAFGVLPRLLLGRLPLGSRPFF